MPARAFKNGDRAKVMYQGAIANQTWPVTVTVMDDTKPGVYVCQVNDLSLLMTFQEDALAPLGG